MGSPSLFYKHAVPERLSSPSDKKWKQDLKNPNFPIFLWMGKFGNAAKAFIKKKKANNFPSFSWIDKNLEGQIKKHVKSKISLWIWKKLEVQPNTKSQKITILNLWMNWEKLLSNLSFTIEIKIGTLRKTFQT